MLIGTNPSVGYFKTSTDDNRRLFARLLTWANKQHHVKATNPRVQARLHTDGDRLFLWLVNPTRSVQTGEVTFAPVYDACGGGKVHWGNGGSAFEGRLFSVPPRDALVLEVDRAGSEKKPGR
jgi:beta-galactosidase